MAIDKKTELAVERRFDGRRSRHSINGVTHVLHCHHYMTLYTQLAEDCAMLDARKLLREAAEDSVAGVLRDYFRNHGIQRLEDRIAIGEEYYAWCGMGRLKVLAAGRDSGEAELESSHLDEGWIKKWGKRDKPVNHFTCGFLAALFAAAFDLPPRAFLVSEAAGIVTGAPRSRFLVVAQ